MYYDKKDSKVENGRRKYRAGTERRLSNKVKKTPETAAGVLGECADTGQVVSYYSMTAD